VTGFGKLTSPVLLCVLGVGNGSDTGAKASHLKKHSKKVCEVKCDHHENMFHPSQ
jgi:hypothetical protein